MSIAPDNLHGGIDKFASHLVTRARQRKERIARAAPAGNSIQKPELYVMAKNKAGEGQAAAENKNA